MATTRTRILFGLAILFLAYAGYATAVSVPNGELTKHVSIVAGTDPDGTMYFHCDVVNSTEGACIDEEGHAQIRAHVRDRLQVRVSTDDGRKHSHDFKLEGAPYALWPAGIEMELNKPTETKSFTAWREGTYRFVCELQGHERAGMWGSLVVS